MYTCLLCATISIGYLNGFVGQLCRLGIAWQGIGPVIALLAIDKRAAMLGLDDDFVSVHESHLVDVCRELAMKVEGFSDVQLEGLA